MGDTKSFRSITWSLRHDDMLPKEVTYLDPNKNFKKWVQAKFLYEDRRRFHKNMTFEEFVIGLRAQRRFDFWTQGEGDTERLWISMHS